MQNYRDGWMEYNNNQPGALNVTDALIKDSPNYDIIISNGDITYAGGCKNDDQSFKKKNLNQSFPE